MRKISIKREQSQAGLSFAERENRRSAAGGKAKFRPQVKNKLLLLLALLLTAATGARAAWTGGTYTATATENLGAITVNGDATLTINSDVTVTVTGGINVASGTLTVTGPGTLVVTGAKGNDGASGWKGSNGSNGGVAISGNIIVQGGATVTATGGNGGTGGSGALEAGTGGNGGVAFAGTLTYKSGTVTANGGSAGSGGYIDDEERYASSGSAGKAFANDVDFTQTTGYSVTNGTSTIGSVLNQTKVVISGGSEPAAATTYTVSLKDGVKDADKWTISPNPAEEGQTVTLQYNGRLKVKGVKATSEAAEASVPEGALNGVFSVSDTKQVYFSKGNLRYESSKWSFFDNQYDYYTSYSADAWDHFGWSTSATTYGMNTSAANSDYSGDFVDWGATMGTGWFTLSSDEWTYLFNTRSASTVNGTENGRYAKAKVNNVGGIILFPDTYTHPDGVTAPTGVNDTGNTGWNGNSYTVEDWTKMESAGCVFLPAAGYRNGSRVNNPGSYGDYSSATPYGTDKTYGVFFGSGSLTPASDGSRFYGCSVRLVQEATSGEPAAKPAATVTTAPTGAAIVGVGKTTALVSGGVAEGGSLMYKVTDENTKPASTDGFSEAVPTAKDITASGKVYVWYYVKGDDTHSDSEIAATAIEVPVADVVWDATNVTDIEVVGDAESYTKEGITLSGNTEDLGAAWYDSGDPTTDGISLRVQASGGFTFTAPTGKKFTKIEMNAVYSNGWDGANLGTGWKFVEDDPNNIYKATWTGSASSTVDLLTGADSFDGEAVKSIAFYLSE